MATSADTNSAGEAMVTMDRRRNDRRQEDGETSSQAGEPRRKVQRRRQIDPTTCERDYSNDEIEFMQALDAWKRQTGNSFPSSAELLNVLRSIGYQKVDEKPVDGD